jgi:hypothetical protein
MKLENGKMYLRDENGNLIEFGATIQSLEFTPNLPDLETDIESLCHKPFPTEASFSGEIQMSELTFNQLAFSRAEDSIFDSEIIG